MAGAAGVAYAAAAILHGVIQTVLCVASGFLRLLFPKFILRIVCRAVSIAGYEILHSFNWMLTSAVLFAEGVLALPVPMWVKCLLCREEFTIPLSHAPPHPSRTRPLARGQEVPDYALGLRRLTAWMAAPWRWLRRRVLRRDRRRDDDAAAAALLRERVVAFEGIPYATTAGRFARPEVVAYNAREGDAADANTSPSRFLRAVYAIAGTPSRVVNAPRLFSWYYNWGTPTCVAPQACRASLDSPLFMHTFQAIGRSLKHGYAGCEDDCLQLNIWVNEATLREATREAPQPDAVSETGRPVVVFVHGGAYLFASGSCRLTSGVEWAKRGVVYVSINYRLGALGWLRVPGKAPNLGLRDVIESLRWVKNNIAKFGGDPTNVTLTGQSAGAMIATQLMGAAQVYNERLATKVMAMSGAPHHIFSQKDAEDAFDLFTSACGLEGKSQEERVQWLETAPLRSILRATDKYIGQELRRQRKDECKRMLPFSPWIEKSGCDVMPRHPVNTIRKRKAAGQYLIPLFIGTTESEFTLFSMSMPLRHRSMQRCPRTLSAKVMSWLSKKTGGGSSSAGVCRSASHRRLPTTAGAPHQPQTPKNPPRRGDAAHEAWAAQAEHLVRRYCDAATPRRFLSPFGVWDAVHTDWVFRAPAQHLASLLVSESLTPYDTLPEQCNPSPGGGGGGHGNGNGNGGGGLGKCPSGDETLLSSQAPSMSDLMLDEYFVPLTPTTAGGASTEGYTKTPSPVSNADRVSSEASRASPTKVSTCTAFVYQFDHRALGGLMSSLHIVDLHYFFGTHHVCPYLSGGYSKKDLGVSRAIMDDVQRYFEYKDVAALCEDYPHLWKGWDPARRPVKVYGVRQQPSSYVGMLLAWMLGLGGDQTQRRTRRSSEVRPPRMPMVRVEDEGECTELVCWGDSFDSMPHLLDEETHACRNDDAASE